ncbi:hypothetical protein [Patulibacter defluvii]|uniref:hypothetical protein n=1 Tax=Patulibacter defluvii TaxID=3095358 RepID=UPI002A748EA8|nr:hypothetical protein [Patulibacter sp. DM4]
MALDETTAGILRLTSAAEQSTIDVHLPIPLATLGRISEALGDSWSMAHLSPDRATLVARHALVTYMSHLSEARFSAAWMDGWEHECRSQVTPAERVILLHLEAAAGWWPTSPDDAARYRDSSTLFADLEDDPAVGAAAPGQGPQGHSDPRGHAGVCRHEGGGAFPTVRDFRDEAS